MFFSKMKMYFSKYVCACAFALLFSIMIHKSSALTGYVQMDSCYDTVRTGYGFRVINGPLVSRVNCTMYFAPPNKDLYFAVRLNNVNLKRIGNSCPTLFVNTFSSFRLDPVPDEWRGSEVQVPADPAPLMQCNCTNYLTQCPNMHFDETKTPGLNIMISYNPDDPDRLVNRMGAFDVTMSSFMRGASFTCPANYFLCWHYKYRCLPESLVCDGEDNCFDNSDEYDYSCTGRIGGMVLPVFVLVILACVVAFGVIVWAAFLIIRRRVANKRLARNEWGEVIKTSDYPASTVQQQSQAGYPDPGMAGSMSYPMGSIHSQKTGSVFDEGTGKPMLT